MKFLFGPVGWCLLAAACFGAATPLCKLLLEQVGPFVLAGGLYLGAGLFTAPSLFKLQLNKTRSIDRRRILGATVFGGILGPVCLLFGLQMGDANSTALLLNLETVFTAILGVWVFKEHGSARMWISVFLVVLASCALLHPVSTTSLTASGLVALACLCWGLDNHFTADITDFTPGQTTCAKGVIAGLMNLGVGYFMTEPVSFTSLGYTLLVGAITYGVSIVLYVAAARQLGASRSQVLFASAPYWGFGLAWMMLAESPTVVHWVAIALMITALWVLNREEHVHAHRHEQMRHAHWHRHDDDHHAHPHGMPNRSYFGWHYHEHEHEEIEHAHDHRADIHHRHH